MQMRHSIVALNNKSNALFGVRVSGDTLVNMEMKFRRMEEDEKMKFEYP